MNTLRVGCVQQACGEHTEDNLAASAAGIRTAAARGARLVLLPELHAGPYFCQGLDSAHFNRAEPVPGPITDRLGALAAELNVVIVGSVFERRASGVYHNTAVVLDGGRGLVGRYRKTHIPEDPGFQEKYYFTPGEGPLSPIATSVGALGLLVCWDQWYPEAARAMALAGAQLLLYPTAIAWDPAEPPAEQVRQREAWITVQRAHAIANHLPVLAANRVGHEQLPGGLPHGLRFWGSSFIAGAQGELLAQAGTHGAEVIVADVDLARTETLRRSWPFLRDRRTDLYGPLLERIKDQ